ncbi:hypothetical protein [Anaeromyxobacter oryzisoli]|uniref:hypothetical protein n=1 Tax=Anaeromyxobacter oryzisoli TaxID=2925408 RepID=UPI001F56202C|nr:hypothetical protein [Anaeromyxobacter sp. SG63]
MPVNRLFTLLALAVSASLPAAASAGDGPIQDNSFLVEEAYNQEPGVIQHISTFNRSLETGAWGYSFTEEWPVRGQTHQASVTFNFSDLRAGPGTRGVGDVLLNYRWQAVGSGETPVAFAPRLSAVLPTGDGRRGLGNGGAGGEVNLPLSVVLSDRFVSHVNLGGRFVPSAQTALGHGNLASFTVGQSLIWLAHHNLNFLVEAVYSSTDIAARDGNLRTESLTVNPGLRAALDIGGLQIVPGFSVPIGVGPSRGDNGLFFYLSFEHPFRLAGPTAPEPAANSRT